MGIRINYDLLFKKLNIYEVDEKGQYVKVLGLTYIEESCEVCLDDVLYCSKEQFQAVVSKIFSEFHQEKQLVKGFYVNPLHLNAFAYCEGIQNAVPVNLQNCKNEKKLSFRFV